MNVDFDILKRKELRAAARLVGRAFEDYEYFTNYFPDLEERRKVLRGVVYREFAYNGNTMRSWSVRKVAAALERLSEDLQCPLWPVIRNIQITTRRQLLW